MYCAKAEAPAAAAVFGVVLAWPEEPAFCPACDRAQRTLGRDCRATPTSNQMRLKFSAATLEPIRLDLV